MPKKQYKLLIFAEGDSARDLLAEVERFAKDMEGSWDEPGKPKTVKVTVGGGGVESGW